jgi:hypothetical protein
MWDQLDPAMEARARRAAKRVGLLAIKSRRLRRTCNNQGGFMLIEPIHNRVVAGVRLELTPQRVIEICAERAQQ